MKKAVKLQPIQGWNRFNLSLRFAHYEQKIDEVIRKGYRVGTYVDVGTWFIVRTFISGMLALLSAGALALVLMVLIGWFNTWLYSAAVLGITYLFWSGGKSISIKNGEMAQITVFGAPVRFYFLSGDFNGIPNVVNVIKKKPMPGISPDGYGYSGEWPIAVWNAYTEGNKDGRETLIVGNAIGGEEVKITLQHVLRHLDLALFNRSPDAVAKIAERARQAARASMSQFTPLDLVRMKDVLALMLVGKRILVCRTNVATQEFALSSIVRDVSGAPIFIVCDNKDEAAASVATFRQQLEDRGDQKMLKVASKVKGGEMDVIILEVQESLVDIIHDYGVWLDRTSVGRVVIPKEIEAAAAQAASQPLEAMTQLANARAAKAARDTMIPTKEEREANPDLLDWAILAQANDPSSKIKPVVIVGGSGKSELSVAAAILNNGKDRT